LRHPLFSQRGNFASSAAGYLDGLYHSPNPVNPGVGHLSDKRDLTLGFVFKAPSLFTSANALNAPSTPPFAFGRNMFLNASELSN
jgi:hypothetical protein